MLKNISNFGTTLNKAQQQSILGGINGGGTTLECDQIPYPCDTGYEPNESCVCVRIPF
ncbi:hypothetical protein [Tenacibaculum aiptasiae]|uniref:hypothetical protein n=1 Tax=Tenacibaculum aiptasiae TaxID=426481 RepID=UPI00232F10ED|nr:hypothetical protein [Tenacibaculum aiptasiae]